MTQSKYPYKKLKKRAIMINLTLIARWSFPAPKATKLGFKGTKILIISRLHCKTTYRIMISKSSSF